MDMTKISYEQYDEIVELYISGLSMLQLSKKYNVSRSKIKNILLKYNISLRDHSHKCRKYDLDEFYFDNINTANKSYILGLLYADGCNYVPQNRIKLELQERDKDVLEQINLEMHSNRPLQFINLHDKNPNWQNTYRLDIVNKHMSAVLVERGVVQNKSLILQPPTCICGEFVRDFIRGYFDGDGHIDKYFITIASTYEVCVWIRDVIKKELDLNMVIHDIACNDKTKILYLYRRKDMMKFLDYLYKDSTLYLQRKYEQYIDLYNSFNNINNSLFD